MCGIVGYTGKKQAAPIILAGLEKLEYRGYDSSGIAINDSNGNIDIIKAKGRLKILCDIVDNGKKLDGFCGIGHTRWATHGVPSDLNAHPHCNENKSIAVVHNGIIENYALLKSKLMRIGYNFYSDTDTEVATKLVDYYYTKYNDPLKAISEFVLHARGSYALAIMFKNFRGKIFAVRKDSPMIIGLAKEGAFLASDVPAILKYTRNIYYIDNYEIVCLDKNEVQFYNLDLEKINKQPTVITWNPEAAEKGGWEHFMLKEIHEQPESVKNTLNYFMSNGDIDLSEVQLSEEFLKDISGIVIAACGSAYHVGLAAQYVFENLVRIPVRVDVASEFRYRNPVMTGKELVIIISQSGETADSLAALRLVKEMGIKTLAIVNVLGSSIAREADSVLYTKAGPEISVATTKAYSAQLAAIYLIALKISLVRNTITREKYEFLINELNSIPDKIIKILNNKAEIQKIAAEMVDKKDMFFIGRGIDYAACIEGSLKLKEVSYIHSEAYAAGELKHGTISLIEEGTLVFGVLTQSKLAEKTISNLVETMSRGAYVVAIVSNGLEKLPDGFKRILCVPDIDENFSASLSVISMQLFAYYLSVFRGNDVDKPRNLAKSVTVE